MLVKALPISRFVFVPSATDETFKKLYSVQALLKPLEIGPFSIPPKSRVCSSLRPNTSIKLNAAITSPEISTCEKVF